MTDISVKSVNRRFAMNWIFTLAIAFGLLFALSSQSAAATYIGETKAKSIALKHAGVSETQANVVNLARYTKRGTMVYKVVFLTDAAKYYYEVDATSGAIVAFNRNARKGGKAVNAAGYQDNRAHIGSEKAKTIAFAHAGVTQASLRKLKVELDNHNGRSAYEVEFTTGDNIEYEYKIDAVTGEILKWEADHD